MAAKLRMLRNYGSKTKNEHLSPGFNSRLDELQAAVLRVKLRHLDGWNGRRRQQAARYGESLRDFDLVLPPDTATAASSWHLFVVRQARRDDLQARLAQAGVATQIHYPVPPHLQPAYRSLGFRPGALPVSESLASTVLSLPVGPHLTYDDQSAIIEALHCVLPQLVHH